MASGFYTLLNVYYVRSISRRINTRYFYLKCRNIYRDVCFLVQQIDKSFGCFSTYLRKKKNNVFTDFRKILRIKFDQEIKKPRDRRAREIYFHLANQCTWKIRIE